MLVRSRGMAPTMTNTAPQRARRSGAQNAVPRAACRRRTVQAMAALPPGQVPDPDPRISGARDQQRAARSSRQARYAAIVSAELDGADRPRGCKRVHMCRAVEAG